MDKNIFYHFNDYVVVNNEGTKSHWLAPLSRINLFIGSNNSGKSRFMRFLFKTYLNTLKDNKVQNIIIDINIIKIVINY